jgi:hypothetical protein
MQYKQQKRAITRRNRLIRIVISVSLGVALGYLCPLLPPQHQALCHLAAKIVGFFAGGASS